MPRLHRSLPIVLAVTLALGGMFWSRAPRRDLSRGSTPPIADWTTPATESVKSDASADRTEPLLPRQIADGIPSCTTTAQRTVCATLPETFAEGILVEGRGARIRQTLVGGSASPKSTESGNAFYREVLPGVDAIVTHAPDQVEEFLHFRESAPAEVTYLLTIESPFHSFRYSGRLEVVDAEGIPCLRLDDLCCWDKSVPESEAVPVDSTLGFLGTRLASLKIHLPDTLVGKEVLLDPSWSSTGSPATARSYHTATLLPNGKVLVAGGRLGNGWLASCELYDPATGTWTATGSMLTGRGFHTATLLQDGRVLAAAGYYKKGQFDLLTTTACELYNPATGTWTKTNPMITSRCSYAATLLANGKVLVMGGLSQPSSSQPGYVIKSCELYDPATKRWTATGSMLVIKDGHTAVRLLDGRVLTNGTGWLDSIGANCELFNPATGTWSQTGQLNLRVEDSSLTLLPDGRVLSAGGHKYDVTNGQNPSYAQCEIYDPANGLWTVTAPLSMVSYAHTATLMTNGTVLVAGLNGTTSCEIYDPLTGTWSPTASMVQSRSAETATLLPSGNVLVVSGTTSELYTP